MKKEFIRYIKKNNLIHKGDTIVVGVSGGADSVCLLLLLQDLKQEWDLTIHVVHIHHGIRGREADRDADCVRELAARLGLPFRLVKKDVPSLAARWGRTEEEAGRIVRYDVFSEYVRQIGGGLIAVAHHRDDQAETVLFQLFRGSGPRGLSGMAPKRGNIIRPLLFAGREEIEAYLNARGISYCTDSTNEMAEYTRNVIRHEILPLAEEKVNAHAAAHIAAAAEKAAAWRQFIEKMGEDAYVRVMSGEDTLNIEKFLREEPVLQDEILRHIFERRVPGAKDIGEIHYGMVRGLMDSGTGKSVRLPGSLVAAREYEEIRFYTEESSCEKAPEDKYPIWTKEEAEKIRHLDYQGVKISIEVKKREDLPAKFPEKDYTKWFDYDMIKDVLILRNPQEGDYFALDSGGKKKLSRYYIDCKIPRCERKKQLVLAEDNHVLWALPGRMSAAYKISDYTKMVLVVTMEMRIRMKEQIKVLIDEETVHAKIRELAERINRDYEGKKVHLVCILSGSVFFTCELAKYIKVPLTMDFMRVSSYGDGTSSSGSISVDQDLKISIENRDVIIVEDIVDSGRTLAFLANMLAKRNPSSLKICTLLDKPDRRVTEVEVAYTGFVIEDLFVVGVGLDYAQKYRNLPYIGELELKED